MVPAGDASEIVFFDVETTIPTRTGQGYAILEFGSITVDSRKLTEIGNYSTLVRPADLNLITPASVRCNGITKEAVASGPSFAEIADTVYGILHGKIWAGHNILRFDCVRIREAFAAINRPAPEPKGTIDSLVLLTQRFGRRAGNMKMATLATYFGLGEQTHRSLDDVRMNLEVLKYCATVLFLESTLPDIFTENNWASPSTASRSSSVVKASPNGVTVNMNSSSSVQLGNHPISSLANERIGESFSTTIPIRHEDVVNGAQHMPNGSDTFDLGALRNEVEKDIIQTDETMEESAVEFPGSSRSGPSGYAGFTEPDEVSLCSITASLIPFHRGSQRIQILHKGATLQLSCNSLKVRFGISTKFLDQAGRPRLSFVVDATPNQCRVLDACDDIARKLSIDSGSDSEWRPLVTRKAGFFSSPTVRFQIPTVGDGNIGRWVTEIYGKGTSGGPPQRLVFSRFDVAELDALLKPGSHVDVFFALETYDYQQNAGIRLVAQKLMIAHSN